MSLSFIERALSAAASSGLFVRHTTERARAEARTGSGPLAGLPYVVKDVFDVEGTPTIAGSQARSMIPAARRDSEVVERLRAAGAVLIGKVTLSELAYSGLGVNRRFGTPVRSIDGVDHLVGGSSSGSAAAVGEGIVPFAIGTDTSGSIRVPAAWAGVLGFKAGSQRYSRVGMLALSPTLDSVGILARDPATLLRVDAVLADQLDGRTARSSNRLVIPHGSLLESCRPDVLEAFGRATDLLAAAGWSIEAETLASVEAARELLDHHPAIVDVEAARRFGRLLDTDHGLESFTARRLRRAIEAMSGGNAAMALDDMASLRRRFTDELGERLLLTPAVAIPAPTREEVNDPDREDALNSQALRISMTLSYLGSPGLSVPTPGAGATFATLLSAPPGGDRHLLGVAERAWRTLTLNASPETASRTR